MNGKVSSNRWMIKILILSVVLAGLGLLAMVASEEASAETVTQVVYTGGGSITSGGTYQLASNFTGIITIGASVTDVKIIGNGIGNKHSNTRIEVAAGRTGPLNLTIENLDIESTSSGIDFGNAGGYQHKLYISGESKVSGHVGIHIPAGISLTINEEAGKVGKVTAIGGSTGAGIGGVNSGTVGTIIISGGEITATGGSSGAGIGGGLSGSGGTITIEDGVVTANGGISGSGIGGGNRGSGGTITISGGTVTANGVGNAAGIGGGAGFSGDDNSGGTIIISGGTITANGGVNAAGIGGGSGGTGGTITISGGVVTARGGHFGAGIGGGNGGTGGTITISDGVVTATGGEFGAGIGGGSGGTGGTITISGGTVTANGVGNAAGIGGGSGGTGGTIIIQNHPTVIATGGSFAVDIGNGASASGATTIKDAENNDLTYIRVEVKNGQSILSNTNIRINGHQHQTNNSGLAGFFVVKSSDTAHGLTVENASVKIEVIPGDAQTIRVPIDVAAANLTGLTISQSDLDPDFSSTHYSYTADVEHKVETINISATGPTGSVISINGQGEPFFPNLAVGDNRFDIVVKLPAPHINYQMEYLLIINRATASNNADLKSLSISAGTLSPAFSKDILSYTATVGHGVSSIIIAAEADDNNAQITGAGTKDLAVGANTIEIKVTAEDGTERIYTITITREIASGGGGDSGGGGSGGGSTGSPSNDPTPPTTTESNAEIIVNGESQAAGNETVSTTNGQKNVEMRVDSKALSQIIDQVAMQNQSDNGQSQNLVEIPIAAQNATSMRIVLTGDIIKKMEDNQFTLVINTEKIDYTIPAQEIGIEKIAALLNLDPEALEQIEVELHILFADESTTQEIYKLGEEKGYQVLVQPVEFKLVAKTTNKAGEVQKTIVTQFSSYVAREIEMPTGIDPSKITTGVLFNQDGTFSHIPTIVHQKDNRWFARLNSKTNSIYTVIWNPAQVSAVENHWSRESVNDMASRLVIKNPETFTPNGDITRGEFAQYMAKGLGLYRTGVAKTVNFSDVPLTHELADAIAIASSYGIISGYPDGTFKPDAQISREEAMTMYARAMAVVQLTATDTNRINDFQDKDQIAAWALEYVQKAVSVGIFNGKTPHTIAPKDTFTYAEAATAIRNLLIRAQLINE